MDELSPEEQKQFVQMQEQEAEEKKVIEAEKTAPVAAAEVAENASSESPEGEKRVPLNALQEERERRKAAEERARQAELSQARLDERMKAINERLNPPAQPREIPDPEKDALGALKATAEEMKAFREFQDRQQAQQHANNQAQRIMAEATRHEAEFMKNNADYNEAGNYLKQARYTELLHLGLSPMDANQTMQQEALGVAATAIRSGKNTAEVIYELAKMRGYKKAQSTTSVQTAQPPSESEKLARIAEGQRSNTSLGNVNSSPSKPQISTKDLLAMDEDQFSQWLDKLPAKDRAKYMGA